METVKAITFDVGGTLIEPWPSVGHVYSAVASEFGFNGVDPAALNRQFARAWKARGAFDYSRAAWRELVNQTFAGLGPQVPSSACFEAIYQRFARAQAWHVFDDVRPALAQLKQLGFRLGIISNWDERLGPLLSELQLASWFEVIVVSHQVGRAKPAPGIFSQAATRLGLRPETILHVGDSQTEDLDGATGAGFQARWLARTGSVAPARALASLAQVAVSLEGSVPLD